MLSSKVIYPSRAKLHEKGAGFIKRHPILPKISIYNALKICCKRFRQEEAIDSFKVKMTFSEMFEQADIVAKAFLALGLKRGDIIVNAIPNCWQGVTFFLAANQIGAVITFLNEQTGIEEIERYLRQYECTFFINYGKEETYNEKIIKNTDVRHIITIHKEDCPLEKPEKVSLYAQEHCCLCYNQLSELAGMQEKQKNLQGKDPAIILYTSGTTGQPKSVVLTNENILATAVYLKNTARIGDTQCEKSLVCVPFCYPYGFVTSVLMSLFCGRMVLLGARISAENIKSYYEKSPNIIFGSPALLEMTLRNIPDGQDLSFIKTFICGGEFLTAALADSALAFFKRHGACVRIANGFGNAETCGGSTTSYGLDMSVLSVGKPLVGTTAIIVDEQLRELPYEKEGMLCIAGKHIFKEYYGEPELTASAKFCYRRKEYFKTGTMGVLNRDGTFRITGRASRFYIISTLEKIYCDYVQTTMGAIDCIEACAVVKKPDKELLYVGKAYIVLKQGIEPAEEIKRYIREQCRKELTMQNGERILLKPNEIPSDIEFISCLPRTKADKVDYQELERRCRDE